MITIKIRDKKWFENNREVRWDAGRRPYMIPSCFPEEHKSGHTTMVFWLGGRMQTLVSKVLNVTREYKGTSQMYVSRYMARGYWMPNWAIEWVKEETV